MILRYRPLPAIWPFGKRTESWARSSPPFKADWTSTMGLLERELRLIGVNTRDAITLEAGFRDQDIRLDGLPRANAHPTDPAIILSFESRYGPLRYGTDRFTTYPANLRAVALGLEALRKVERYGITHRGEQYTGFKALPAHGESLSAREALYALFEMADVSIDMRDLVTSEEAYRRAVKHAHPDTPTGSREAWDRLQRVKTVLGL